MDLRRTLVLLLIVACVMASVLWPRPWVHGVTAVVLILVCVRFAELRRGEGP